MDHWEARFQAVFLTFRDTLMAHTYYARFNRNEIQCSLNLHARARTTDLWNIRHRNPASVETDSVGMWVEVRGLLWLLTQERVSRKVEFIYSGPLILPWELCTLDQGHQRSHSSSMTQPSRLGGPSVQEMASQNFVGNPIKRQQVASWTSTPVNSAECYRLGPPVLQSSHVVSNGEYYVRLGVRNNVTIETHR